jgi:hypothetical protein
MELSTRKQHMGKAILINTVIIVPNITSQEGYKYKQKHA